MSPTSSGPGGTDCLPCSIILNIVYDNLCNVISTRS